MSLDYCRYVQIVGSQFDPNNLNPFCLVLKAKVSGW